MTSPFMKTSAALLVRANRLAAGLAARTVRVGSHVVSYLDAGSGPAVVLLHGIFAEKDHWVDFARHLTRRWRVIVPDLPGYGESTRIESESYAYAQQTARLAGLLDALAVRAAHVAGSSMGGTLAALLARSRADLVASVAFVGAPHGLRTPQPSAMDRLIDQGRAPLVVHTRAQFDDMLDLLFGKRPFIPYPIRHVAAAGAIERAGSNLRLWHQQLQDRYLLQDCIAGVAQPVSVQWGALDRLFDVSGLPALGARCARGHVHRLDGIGHLPMMEAPRQSAGLYSRFLESVAA